MLSEAVSDRKEVVTSTIATLQGQSKFIAPWRTWTITVLEAGNTPVDVPA